MSKKMKIFMTVVVMVTLVMIVGKHIKHNLDMAELWVMAHAEDARWCAEFIGRDALDSEDLEIEKKYTLDGIEYQVLISVDMLYQDDWRFEYQPNYYRAEKSWSEIMFR